MPHLKDHLIICGWNDRVPALIREITTTNRWVKGRKVVVLSEHTQEKPLEPFGLIPGSAFFCRGISSDYDKLKEVNLKDAYCAVIVADYHKIQRGNLRGLYTAVALRKTRPEKEFKIITELYYEFNEDRFRYAGVTKLIPLERMSSSVMAHACMNPGISDLLVRILSFDASQVALFVGAAEDKKILLAVKDRTFNKAMKELRKQNILLLAVYRVSEKDTGHAETELDFRNPSPYFLNPSAQEEYRISEKDSLLIIKSNIADTSSEQTWSLELGKNLPKQSKTRIYDATNEHLLIIGRGKEIRDIVGTVSNFAQSIISISMEENGKPEITVSERSGARKLIEDEELADFSLEHLESLVCKHKNIFSKVTRAVILEVSPVDSGLEQEDVIYQDDAELSYAIVLLDLYRKLFGRDLHIAAEMRADVNLHLYHDIGIAQPIPINRLVELILARMVFHGGLISEFFLKTMSYRPDNRKVRLKKQSVAALSRELGEELVSKTFDEVLEIFFKHPVQLLAFVKADGEIVLNPKSNSDAATTVKLEADDSLFIFVQPNAFVPKLQLSTEQ
uniref:RCK C-terminal domain-containing protein n=1 Tax=Candidatus Kentrum sp. TUN TaxID=2126343 RepID=A0A451AFP2_9GAMM|nr:MAG: hypothetical protein BECKTUN1418D_GA0071000_12932 [Candidatus Kentron sp. TUN]